MFYQTLQYKNFPLKLHLNSVNNRETLVKGYWTKQGKSVQQPYVYCIKLKGS